MLLLAACTPAYDLTVAPPALDFGIIDFAEDMPDEGYEPSEVSITNTGDRAVGALVLSGWDPDHLCVQGYDEDDLPIPLGELNEGSFYLLTVAVCGYIPGERDSVVTTEVTLATDGEPATLTVPVRFTPTLRMDTDDS